jgi:hypothetical protein
MASRVADSKLMNGIIFGHILFLEFDTFLEYVATV